MPDGSTVYAFGVFEFDSSSGELRRNGRLIALEPQPARALALMLACAGDVVSRDALRAVIWGNDTHVDFDRGLAYVVSQIRLALGDSADNPRFVQTLPRKGYKFIAPMRLVSPTPDTGNGEIITSGPAAIDEPQQTSEPRDRHWLWLGAGALVLLSSTLLMLRPGDQAASPPVVAVSIFDNETGDAALDLRVETLSDAVVARLTEMGQDRVHIVGNAAPLRRPRNIRNLQSLRAELQADYVLLGQLQRADRGLRFITHFIRLRDEAHLRANRLAFPDGDLSQLERVVVGEFERVVGEHLASARP
jgi:DNA-binding winged helix-turn-helix (wHTH) protein/TolB-like protein